MAKQGFSEPQLYDCGGNLSKEWYVSFRMTNPVTGERKPFPHRRGLNYLHTKVERYAEGKALCSLLKQALLRGWNPFEKDYETFELTADVAPAASKINDTPEVMPFNQALEYSLVSKKKSIAAKSYKDYEVVVRFACEAADNLGIAAMPVGQTKKQHIKALLQQMQDDRIAAYQKEYDEKIARFKKRYSNYKGKAPQLMEFTGNTYNKYKEFLHIIFSELEDYGAIEFNPCARIKDRVQIKTNKHRHATAREEQIIKEYLKGKHYRFYVYLAFIELTGLRPKEILGLQVHDIDWFNQCIDIHANDGKSKTREARLVAIPNVMLPLLHKLELEHHNPTDFIFSHAMQPGPVRLKRDSATSLWSNLVKRDLGIDVTMYSFKGLGGEKKRAAGIDKVAVQKQMGHTKSTTTDIYLPREDEQRRQVIIDKTPEF